MADTLRSYTDLINRVVNDFNNIYNQMVSKGVVKNNTGSTILTTSDVIPTNEYATYIDNQLFRVSGKFKSDLSSKLVNNEIRYYGSSTQAAGATIAWNNTDATVTFTLPNPGFYDTTIFKTLTSTPVAITSTNIGDYAVTDDEVITGYTVTPPAGTLLGPVSFGVGGYTVTDYTYTKSNETITPTTSYDTTSVVQQATGSDTGYAFKVKKSASYSVTSTAQVNTATVTAGYLADNSTINIANAVDTLTGSSSETVDTYYIKSGSVGSASIATGTGDLTIGAATGGITLTSADDYDQLVASAQANYYQLSATMGSASITGQTVEGYISGGNSVNLGTLASRSVNYYVQKATVANTTETATITASGTANTSSLIASEASSGNTNPDYILSISSTKSGTGAITEGYIKTGTYSYDVSGSETYYIKHGKVVATPSTSAPSISAGSGYLDSGTNGKKVTLTTTPTVSFTTNQEGYIKAADVSAAAATAVTKDIYIKNGSVTANATLSVNAINRDDGKTGYQTSGSNVISIFQNEAPSTGDYYEVQAIIENPVVTSGWIDTITTNNSNKRYVPKATFRYVENSTSGNFIEVLSGGYVPSGTIAGVAEISGSLDLASVPVIATADAGSVLMQTAGTVNDYTITLGKGTVNAGYISQNEGTISGSLYIHHGSAAITSALDGDWTVSSATLSGSTYTITVSGNVENTVTLDAGYIKSTDITTNGDSGLTGTVSLSTSVELDRAVLAASAQDVRLHATASNNIILAGNGETATYTITPHISANSKVTVGASTAGYISNETTDLAITDHAATETVLAIHAGTGNSASGNAAHAASITSGSIDISSLNATTSGNYTITASNIVVNSTTQLDEGYYGTNNKNITTISTVSLPSATIAHGSATITSSAVVSIDGAGSTLNTFTASDISSRNATDFIALTANIASISVNKLVTTGYVKDADVTISAPDTTSGSDTVYIEKVHLTESASGETYSTYAGTNVGTATTVYTNVTLGSKTGAIDTASDIASSTAHSSDTSSTVGLRDTAYIDTKDKYATHDIKVTLTADAMGTTVASELNRLRTRLNGTISS